MKQSRSDRSHSTCSVCVSSLSFCNVCFISCGFAIACLDLMSCTGTGYVTAKSPTWTEVKYESAGGSRADLFTMGHRVWGEKKQNKQSSSECSWKVGQDSVLVFLSLVYYVHRIHNSPYSEYPLVISLD